MGNLETGRAIAVLAQNTMKSFRSSGSFPTPQLAKVLLDASCYPYMGATVSFDLTGDDNFDAQEAHYTSLTDPHPLCDLGILMALSFVTFRPAPLRLVLERYNFNTNLKPSMRAPLLADDSHPFTLWDEEVLTPFYARNRFVWP
jgi:hypothetical protein